MRKLIILITKQGGKSIRCVGSIEVINDPFNDNICASDSQIDWTNQW